MSDDYHSHPALGSTALRELLRSPMHYFVRFEAPEDQRVAEEPTPAMRLGTLVHAAVLEPDWWATSFVVAPKCDRRTKAGKATWSEFLERAHGKTIVKPDELRAVESMAAAVRAHPAARHALDLADRREAPFFWTDDRSGVPCKGKADAIGHGLILDLKTCQDASPAAWARQVAKHRYHLQAAHYIDGAEATGFSFEAWVWIAVETAPPHAVGVYVADTDMLERAADTRLRALDTLLDCRTAGHWPSYSTRFETIDLPPWY